MGNAPIQGHVWTDLSMLTLSNSSFELAPEATTDITITLDRQGLATGTYEDIGAYLETEERKVALQVAFEVPEAPHLVLTPGELDFGDSEEEFEALVRNEGLGDGRFHITDIPTWAAVDRTEGTALDGAGLRVRVSREELPSGTHEDYVRLSYEGGEVLLRLHLQVPYPETRLLTGTVPGETVRVDRVRFALDGGDLYRWRLDGGPWSERDEGAVECGGLNEGDHLFEAVALRRAGGEDPTLLAIPFKVDTVDGVALWLQVSVHRPVVGKEFQVRLIGGGIERLEVLQVELRFNPDVLKLLSISAGSGLLSDGEIPDLWFSEIGSGRLRLLTGMPGGAIGDEQGRVELANLVFRALSEEASTQIEIEIADLRASLTEPVQLEVRKGISLQVQAPS